MTHLLVVSQKNQALRLARLLTRDPSGISILEKIKNNAILLYLDWGDPTAPVPSQLNELAETVGTQNLTRISVPGNSYLITKARLRDFETIYQSFCEQTGKIESAFLFSYEGHYSVLATFLHQTGTKLYLVEDGLGMFVHGEENQRVQIPNTFQTLFFAARGLVGPIMRQALNFSIRGLLIRFSREVFWGLFGKDRRNRELLQRGFREFDVCITTFPELAREMFKSAEQINVPFPLLMLEAVDKSDFGEMSKTFSSNDGVLLLQTYPFTQDEMESLIQLALKQVSGTLWVKTHPRTPEASLQLIHSACQNVESVRTQIINLELPAENIIATFKPRKVFSLASTTLTYVQKLSPETEVASLADFALDFLAKTNDRRARRLVSTLSADRAILNKFPSVTQITK